MRRGVEISMTTLLESLVIAILIFATLVFGYKVYQVFFGPDKTALNTFELMADNINSLLRSDEPSKELSFRFTAHHREDYKGTIYAIGSDGITDPFPPMPGARRGEFLSAKDQIDVLALQKEECDGKPCLCFSKVALEKSDDAKEIAAVMNNPTRCRKFDAAEGTTIAFEATPMDTNLDLKGDDYPIVTLKKKTSGNAVKIWILMSAPAATTT